MKDKSLKKLRESESLILFILLIAFLIILIIIYAYLELNPKIVESSKEESPVFCFLVRFGFLAIISLPPLAYMGYWVFRTRSKALSISLALGIVAILLNTYLALCNKMPCSTTQWCCRMSDNYFPDICTFLFSGFYGIICINSCLLGLQILRSSFFDKRFSFLRTISVFISVAFVLYLFLLERIERVEGHLELQFDPFLLSFIFLTIAVSFLYVMLGYYSQDNYGTPNPLIFLISAIMSFSIGVTISVFVLHYERVVGTLISHWSFLCIWTLFATNLPLLVSEKTAGLSKVIGRILSFLTEKR